MKTIGCFIAVVAACNCAVADNQPQTLPEKLTDEYAACAAYYQIVSVDLEKLGRNDSAANAYAASETALQYSYLAAHEERSEETAREVARARFEFYIKGIAKHMDKKTSNISALAGRPGQRCKYAIEDPDAFRDELAKDTTKGIDD
jgi:hypothetical protein